MARDTRNETSVEPATSPPAPSSPGGKPPSVESAPPSWHAYQTGRATMRVKRINFGGPVTGRPELRYCWQHQAAAQLHGWTAHELATGGQEVWISRADYEAALVTVSAEKIEPKPPAAPPKRVPHGRNLIPGVSAYTPHAGAMSKYAPKLETRKA